MSDSTEHVGLLRRILRAIGRPIGRFFDWLDRFLGRAILRAFAVPFLIGGSLAVYYGTQAFLLSFEIPNWPSVPGVVTRSRVGHGSKVRYVSMLEYEYEVAGESYIGKRVRRGESQGLESPVENRIARYPVGTRVHVLYNPEDPSDAVLEAGIDWFSLFPIGAGGLFVFAGQWCWRTRKRISELEFN